MSRITTLPAVHGLTRNTRSPACILTSTETRTVPPACGSDSLTGQKRLLSCCRRNCCRRNCCRRNCCRRNCCRRSGMVSKCHAGKANFGLLPQFHATVQFAGLQTTDSRGCSHSRPKQSNHDLTSGTVHDTHDRKPNEWGRNTLNLA